MVAVAVHHRPLAVLSLARLAAAAARAAVAAVAAHHHQRLQAA